MHFICIAFLIKNKNKIKEVEEAQVPSIISQLKFKDKDLTIAQLLNDYLGEKKYEDDCPICNSNNA